MTPIQDTASFFCFSIAHILKLDEEYRANWRYKHKQDVLKEPIRQAVKNTKSWAEKIAAHLELKPEPDQFERYTAKVWTAWEAYIKARQDYLFESKSATNLKALKEAEATLKIHTKALNYIISTL